MKGEKKKSYNDLAVFPLRQYHPTHPTPKSEKTQTKLKPNKQQKR